MVIENLLIVGNGFDLGLGLKTSYQNFKDYLLNLIECTDYEELITNDEDGKHYTLDDKVIDKLISQVDGPMYDSGHHGDTIGSEFAALYFLWLFRSEYGEMWNDVETNLAYVDIGELVDRIIYDDKEEWEQVDLYESFKRPFLDLHQSIKRDLLYQWIKSIVVEDLDKINKYSGPIEKADKIINFNYTRTIEENYSYNDEDIYHIHGEVDCPMSLQFGYKDSSDHTKNIENIEENFTDEIMRSMVKDTIDNIEPLIIFLSEQDDVLEIEKITSIGFGFGEVDMIYIERILKRIQNDCLTWTFDSHKTCHDDEKKKIKKAWKNADKCDDKIIFTEGIFK